MGSNYPEGSMRGSGIYGDEFDYGTFVCDYCGKTTEDALAYVDDFNNWEVECEHCSLPHASGNLHDDKEDY